LSVRIFNLLVASDLAIYLVGIRNTVKSWFFKSESNRAHFKEFHNVYLN